MGKGKERIVAEGIGEITPSLSPFLRLRFSPFHIQFPLYGGQKTEIINKESLRLEIK